MVAALPSDRRRSVRIEVDDLAGGITVVEPMRIAQISTTGGQIDTTAPLGVGSLHDVRLTLDDQHLVVKARAVHSTVRQIYRDQLFYRTGIEFIELTGPAAQALAAFVEARTNRPERAKPRQP